MCVLGSDKRRRLLFIFFAVYRLVAATAHGTDEGHIFIFSGIFKGSEGIGGRQHNAGSGTEQELAIGWCLVIMEINSKALKQRIGGLLL